MVHGIEIFREYFKEHAHQYVLIGGTACDILMDDLGSSFRATKDLDVVLIIESFDAKFSEQLWKFINDGGYEHREKETSRNQFYRFIKPKNSSFPKQIELFCKLPDVIELGLNQRYTPLVVNDNIISLSAILLDDNYYDLLISRKKNLDELSLIDIETAIVFKIKAWLDNKAKRESGEKISSTDVNKHKNDVLRLLINISPSTKIQLTDAVKYDVVQFIEKIREEKPDLKSLGIKGTNLEDILKILKDGFLES
ncbi:MAG: hypothetical protein KGZ51_07250 [Erysipelothrix sp.]|nr:hypothetical protein [Erysipelothrix sp.]